MLRMLLVLLGLCLTFQLIAQPTFNLDPAFGNNGVLLKTMNGSALSMRMISQPDGKILVVGRTVSDGFVSRFLPDGKVDSTFGSNGTALVSIHDTAGDLTQLMDIVILPNRLLAVGFVHHRNFDTTILAAFDTSGNVDSSFGINGIRSIRFTSAVHESCKRMLLVNDSSIALAGLALNPITFRMNMMVSKVNVNGLPDTTFNHTGYQLINSGEPTDDFVSDMTIDSKGNIYVGGSASYLLSGIAYADALVAKLRDNGTIDSSFATNGRYRRNIHSFSGLDHLDRWNTLLMQQNKLLLAGQTARGSQGEFVLSRIDTNGIIDNNFAFNGSVQTNLCHLNIGQTWISHLATLPDNRIIVGGNFNCGVASNARLFIARFSEDGMLDDSIGTDGFVKMYSVQGRDEIATGMMLAANGSIYQCAQSMKSTNFDVDLVMIKYNASLLPSSVNNLTSKDIKIYPTTAEPGDIIQIVFNKAGNSTVQLSLIDISGKVLAAQPVLTTFGSNNFKLPETLADGLYFLKISEHGTSFTKKLVVQ